MSFTIKALRELAGTGVGLDTRDACEILASLTVDDFVARLESESTGEWMYLFKPALAGMILYVKLIVRTHCLVVSFHEDEAEFGEGQS